MGGTTTDAQEGQEQQGEDGVDGHGPRGREEVFAVLRHAHEALQGRRGKEVVDLGPEGRLPVVLVGGDVVHDVAVDDPEKEERTEEGDAGQSRSLPAAVAEARERDSPQEEEKEATSRS